MSARQLQAKMERSPPGTGDENTWINQGIIKKVPKKNLQACAIVHGVLA
jgi:hypothetical protein